MLIRTSLRQPATRLIRGVQLGTPWLTLTYCSCCKHSSNHSDASIPQENGTNVSEQLVKQTSASSIDNYWQYPDQQWSQYVHLDANQSILLDGAHCCNRHGGHFQVRG